MCYAQAQEVNPLAGQDEHEILETLFRNVDLNFAESLLRGCFHASGAGRLPRNLLGIFRTFIVMRMKGVRSLREMARLLDADTRFRKLLLAKTGETGYPRSVLSRFIRKVGEDKLTRIIEEKVVKLLKSNSTGEVDVVLDASFIKAWSTRHPLDSQRGLSDGDTRVGRAGRTFGLGYKLHLSIDSQSMLPLTCAFASTNQNEKKPSLNMLEKTKLILRRSAARLTSVIADSQYSECKLRNAADVTVIPHLANQKRGAKGLLRVDEKFRTYGSENLKRKYHKNPSIEAVYSFLKAQYSLAMNKVRGLKNIPPHALHSILYLDLNRKAALNLHRNLAGYIVSKTTPKY